MNKEERERALAQFQVGNLFFEQHQYGRALREYESAIVAWDHPAIRGNMAVCKLHLDRPALAYEDLQAALRYDGDPFEGPIYSHLRTLQKTLLGQLSRLKVSAKQPGLRIFLDGNEVFVEPGNPYRVVAAGNHRLVASKANHLTRSYALTLLPGKERVLDVKLVSLEAAGTYDRKWRRWVPWSIVAGGAAVALVGLPFQLAADSNAKEYGRQLRAQCLEGCPVAEQPTILRSLENRATRQSRAALSLFIAGGAATLIGGVMTYMNRPIFTKAKNSDEPQATLVPIVGRDSGGIAFRGRF